MGGEKRHATLQPDALDAEQPHVGGEKEGGIFPLTGYAEEQPHVGGEKTLA